MGGADSATGRAVGGVVGAGAAGLCRGTGCSPGLVFCSVTSERVVWPGQRRHAQPSTVHRLPAAGTAAPRRSVLSVREGPSTPAKLHSG